VERKVAWINRLQSGTTEVFPCPNPQREAYFLRQALRALPKHLETFGQLASVLRYNYKVAISPRSVVATPRLGEEPLAGAISAQWLGTTVVEVVDIILKHPEITTHEFPDFEPTDKKIAQLKAWADKYDYDVSNDTGCLRITRK